MLLKSLKIILVVIFISITFKTSKAENLKDVLVDTFNNYPDISKSKIELLNKKKDLSKSKTDFFPSIDFSMSQGRSITQSFPDTSNHNINELNPSTIDIDVSQPLGATKYLNLKSSENNLKAQEYSNKSVIQDILLRASKAYYTLLKERFLLDVALKNEKNLIQKFDATEKRFDFKDVTKTDVFQAKARLAEATSKRIEAENNLEIAISEFIAVVGREPKINWYSANGEPITKSNPLDWSKFGKLPEIPISLEESIKLAMEKNPDLNKLKFELKNTELDIKKSTLTFFPEFSISASYGRSLRSTRTINKKDTYELTADVTVPLFNKGHNFIDLEKSKNSALAIQKSLESKKINLKHEIQSAWKKIESLKSSIKSLEVSVESNIVALEGVAKEAGVGTRTTLNILDAEKELTQAEANLVNSRFQLITSSFDLLKSCGLITLNDLKAN